MPCKKHLVCTSCFRYGPTKATKPADKIKRTFRCRYLLACRCSSRRPCITTKIWEGGKDKRSSAVETLYHDLCCFSGQSFCETYFVIRLDYLPLRSAPPSLSQPQPNPHEHLFVATNAGCTASDTTEYSFSTSSSPSGAPAWHA